MRMFVDIYVFVVQMRWIAVVRIRIFRIMRIFRIGTMRGIVFTLTLVLSHQGRGDSGGCFGLFHPRHALPCGFPPTRE